jgi:hypothetical protein
MDNKETKIPFYAQYLFGMTKWDFSVKVFQIPLLTHHLWHSKTTAWDFFWEQYNKTENTEKFQMKKISPWDYWTVWNACKVFYM